MRRITISVARNAAAAIEDAQHAVQVGRVLEELNYRWYEETLSDRGLPYLKKTVRDAGRARARSRVLDVWAAIFPWCG